MSTFCFTSGQLRSRHTLGTTHRSFWLGINVTWKRRGWFRWRVGGCWQNSSVSVDCDILKLFIVTSRQKMVGLLTDCLHFDKEASVCVFYATLSAFWRLWILWDQCQGQHKRQTDVWAARGPHLWQDVGEFRDWPSGHHGNPERQTDWQPPAPPTGQLWLLVASRSQPGATAWG